jgi:hypothetical protein
MAVTILVVFAFCLFAIAALWPLWNGPEPHRISIIAAGLACWVASTFITHL